MKQILTILFLYSMLNTHSIYGQTVFAFSNAVTISKEELKSEKIEKYVKNKMDLWREKLPTEDSRSWNNRINDDQVKKRKIDDLLTEAILTVGKDEINFDNPEIYYDDENEVLQIQYKNLNAIYIEIPNGDESFSFIENKQIIDHQNERFALKNDAYILTHIELSDPTTGEEYIYDIDKPVTFKGNNMIAQSGIDVGDINNYKIAENKVSIKYANANSDVDIDIPVNPNYKNSSAVAVIIGNANYKKVSTIKYALNDIDAMRKYLIGVLGFSEKNILSYQDATLTDFTTLFSSEGGKLSNFIEPNISDVFIYYSGHGVPSIKNHKQYFMPVDADPSYIEQAGYSFEQFYDNLGKIPAHSYTLVIDACFSGSKAYDGSGKKPGLITVEEADNVVKNAVVLTASTGSETSIEYEDKKHGLFTYYFLKAIQDKNRCDTNKDSKITYEELYEYLSDKTNGIPAEARKLGNPQTPTINATPELKKTIFLKY